MTLNNFRQSGSHPYFHFDTNTRFYTEQNFVKSFFCEQQPLTIFLKILNCHNFVKSQPIFLWKVNFIIIWPQFSFCMKIGFYSLSIFSIPFL